MAEYISTSPYILCCCNIKFFQDILSWGRRTYSLPAAQYLGCRVDYSLVPPPSTISPVMSQRDYQLLRFPHSNINIALSSQFSSSKVLQLEAYQLSSPGKEIILLLLSLFAPTSFHYPFLLLPKDYPCFSETLFHHRHVQFDHHYYLFVSFIP